MLLQLQHAAAGMSQVSLICLASQQHTQFSRL